MLCVGIIELKQKQQNRKSYENVGITKLIIVI